MQDVNIFYTTRYLKYIEDTEKIKISCFKVKKNKKAAFFPHYIQNNAIFGLRYGGIIANSKNSDFIKCVASSFMEYLRRRGIKRFYIRNNPFENTIKTGKIIKKEPFVCINLKKTLAKIYDNISKKHKKSIQAALEENLITRESKNSQYLLLFYKFYKNLLAAKGIAAARFSSFERLHYYLANNLSFIYVRYKRQTVAVSVVLESKPNVFMMYGAMNEEGYDKCAKHLMIYELMSRYKKRGYSRLVLGTGVDGQKDSVYRFKRDFTNKESYIYTYGTNI